MAACKLWNLNTIDFEQEHNGEIIKIPAKGFVVMDFEEACTFKAKFYMPPEKDGMDQPLIKNMKMLKLERDPNVSYGESKPHCPVCREVLTSWDALDSHTAAMHQAQVLQDDEYQKYLKQKETGRDAKAAKSAGGAA